MRYEQYLHVIDEKNDIFCHISDFLWEHPEIPFHEYEAAKLITDMLEKAKEEHAEKTGGCYICPIPADLLPDTPENLGKHH